MRMRTVWRAGRRSLAAGAAVAVTVPMLTAMVPAPGTSALTPAALRPVRSPHFVPVHAVGSRPVPVRKTIAWHLPGITWPAPGTATVDVRSAVAKMTAAQEASALHAAGRGNAAMAAVTPGSVRAGSEPVWIGPSLARADQGSSLAPGAVTVTMASRRAAAAAGADGVLFTLSHASTAATAVHVSLDYSAFADADGGNFAARLRLAEFPACALTTPGKPACRKQTALVIGDDVTTSRLGADVTIPASSADSAGGMLVLAAMTSASGSAGNFAATPLSDAGTWAAGGNSGAFTYSYPIGVPPVPGGLAPHVNLDYNSQSLDGLTSSTNDQASWVGQGWDYQPGFIERDYLPCSQTSAKTGDLCWSSNDVTTLSLNGSTTTLVQDSTSGKWHAQNDQGDEISYLTGSGTNGTHDDDYWVITDQSGTSYYFGMNELPGYTSSDTQTDSSWTVPVYATASGQPCYKSTFASSSCPQAWRWNLDFVTDAHGDAITYYYNSETNYYAADSGTTGTAAYTQGGALSKIMYGLRASSPYGSPAAEVTFTTAETRTDIPTGSSQDLACAKNAACNVQSPTFWSKYQLNTIATEALNGSSLKPADSWSLTHDYAATNDLTTTPSLWLTSITRTGEDGGSAALPPVAFGPNPMPNRVASQQDQNDGYSLLTMVRVSSVTNETGGTVSVNYDTPPSSCLSGNFPAEDANQTVCYPDYWTPPGASQPVKDWFNKYVVSNVTQSSTQVDSQAVSTSYCYGAAPGCLSGGGWHYDDDPLLKSSQRTWDQWRGFATVTTSQGIAPDPVTDTVDRYFQGMNGDYQTGGGSTSASLSGTVGGVTATATDNNQWAGTNFEHAVYNGSGGGLVSATLTTPWTSAATATQTGMPSPLPSLTAYLTGTAKTQAFTALGTPGGSGGFREADHVYGHDTSGRVKSDFSAPDAADNGGAGDSSEDTCTQTAYASNDSQTSWPVVFPAQVTVTSVTSSSACPVTGTPTKAELVSDMTYYYDGNTSLTGAPTHGDVTKAQKATSYTGSSENFTTAQQSACDQYGRATSQTDADGNTTTTAYTPATGAEPSTIAVTSPPVPNDSTGLVTTTTYDPVRELPLTVTNPANLLTSETYDALGRLTAAWTPGHPQANAPAQETFSYHVSATGPSVVTTNTINPAGTYLPSETLYDSLGRVVETQTETATGNRDVTDTTYNTDGWQLVTAGPYSAAGAPSSTLVEAAQSQVPDETGYFYDGTGRVLRQVAYNDATEKWETDSAYGGDYTTVTPPAGGTAQTTYVNGQGQVGYIYQYHSATPPSTPPAPGSGSTTGSSGWDQTAYTYFPAGQLSGITDAAGNHWSYGYDLAGDQTSAIDPDTGTTSSTYDLNGNLLSVTDARAKITSFTYDAVGRKIAEYDTTGNAGETGSDELASWTYDSVAKGKLSSSTSYTGGTGGSAYTTGVMGYNAYGLPTGTQTIIPAAAGALAGTYKQTDTYTTNGNRLGSYFDYAAAGLPAETVNIGYNSADQPVSVGSSLWYYVSALSWTELGQPQEYVFGPSTAPAWLYDNYNLQTGQLTNSETQAGSTPVTVSNLSYGYNNAGDVTTESDSTTGNYQCYQYNYLGDLSDAWAQGSSGCAATPSASVLGGPSPYWQHLAYDTAGNITADNWTYSATNYSTAANSYGPSQPHTMTSQNVNSSAYGGWTGTDTWDAAGHLTDYQSGGYLQNFAWNDLGKLATATDNSGNSSSYIYDADGHLLLQTDNKVTTLYLPDEQITADTSTSPATIGGTRYYSLGGATVAARPSSGDIQYLSGDQHGTGTTAIDASTLAVSRRYYSPFGALLWPFPSSWIGTRSFVGGTADTATSLTNIGARELSPSLSTFISPDPVLTPYNPQDLDPYSYAANNPATNADPTGMVTEEMGDGATSCEDNNTCPKNQSLTSFVGGSPGFLGDVSGGFADTVINTVRLVTDPIAAMTSPQLHMWGNQNSGGYELGQALSAVAPAVAGGPEADAALFGADVGTDAGLGVLGDTAGSTAGRATMDIQGVYRGGPIVGLDNSVDAAVTRSADGTWSSRGSWSLGSPARTDLGTASAGTGQPATYAVSVANPEASTVAGVLTENEDDLTNALTAYSGSAHALDPGIPAVSDPVASATVVAAALIAALFQSLAGTGG